MSFALLPLSMGILMWLLSRLAADVPTCQPQQAGKVFEPVLLQGFVLQDEFYDGMASHQVDHMSMHEFGFPEFDCFSDWGTEVNPATGLLMVGGIGGMDVAGNAYGVSSPSGSFLDPFCGTGMGHFSSGDPCSLNDSLLWEGGSGGFDSGLGSIGTGGSFDDW